MTRIYSIWSPGAASRPRLRLLHEVRPQRLAPVRDGGDLLLPQQYLGLLLHVRLEVAREAGIDVDEAHCLAERLLRERVTFRGVERVDCIRDLVRVVLEVARDLEPGF